MSGPSKQLPAEEQGEVDQSEYPKARDTDSKTALSDQRKPARLLSIGEDVGRRILRAETPCGRSHGNPCKPYNKQQREPSDWDKECTNRLRSGNSERVLDECNRKRKDAACKRQYLLECVKGTLVRLGRAVGHSEALVTWIKNPSDAFCTFRERRKKILEAHGLFSPSRQMGILEGTSNKSLAESFPSMRI